MKREIKFRVWDSDDKALRYFDLKEKSKEIFWLSKAIENYSPQQFTGLKDKNNVDIYEGDIVKTSLLPMHVWEVKFGEHRCFMETGQYYDAYGFYFSGLKPHCQGYNETLIELKVEIIGNIHQTPELLS